MHQNVLHESNALKQKNFSPKQSTLVKYILFSVCSTLRMVQCTIVVGLEVYCTPVAVQSPTVGSPVTALKAVVMLQWPPHQRLKANHLNYNMFTYAIPHLNMQCLVSLNTEYCLRVSLVKFRLSNM